MKDDTVWTQFPTAGILNNISGGIELPAAIWSFELLLLAIKGDQRLQKDAGEIGFPSAKG
jgi:hypothetical protein